MYCINDSGNSSSIFKLNLKGKIIDEIFIDGIENKDWEAITMDANHNLYIADFGNNKNERKDLKVYKIENYLSDKPIVSITTFNLSDQTEFPPKKSNRNFDLEAFISKGSFLYLFTRNRSSSFNGETKIYRLTKKPGIHEAQLINTLFIGKDKDDCFITDAAINQAEDKIALLTYNKILLLDSLNTETLTNHKIFKIKLKHTSQKEGITFINDSTLMIVDERSKHNGNFLYKFELTD